MKKFFFIVIVGLLTCCGRENKNVIGKNKRELYLDSINPLNMKEDIYFFLLNYSSKISGRALYFIKVNIDSIVICSSPYINDDILEKTLPTILVKIENKTFLLDFNSSEIYNDSIINTYKRYLKFHFKEFELDSNSLTYTWDYPARKLYKDVSGSYKEGHAINFLAPRIVSYEDSKAVKF